MTVAAEYRLPLARGLAGVWLALAGLAAFVFVPALHFELPRGINVALHTAMETASVVVSLLVFSVGWATRGSRPLAVVPQVSAVFLAVGLLDFVHLLFYEGMPAISSRPQVGTAIALFLAARLLVAVGLVAIAFGGYERPPDRARQRLLVLATLGFACATIAGTLMVERLPSLFFVPGRGLTPLKIGLDYAIVALNLAAAVGFARRLASHQAFPVVELLTAALLMAVSEFCFTLYATTADQYINYAHLLKIAAYAVVWKAMFAKAVLRPYDDLERTRQELVALNASLEQRVEERTAQLAAANHDLEAFSYTVAHDLRGPLVALGGFSEVLQLQSGGKLDERETHYLQRIRVATAQMMGMIDALLDLARLSRAPVAPEPVDLGALAEEIVESHRASAPARAVDLTVHRPLHAVGDPRLLRLVMQNLIGNAWKFTSVRERAAIAVGAERGEDGEAVYYVRDNGAGFDLAHAQRLFAPFQRMHAQSEFPGHGIGLANVSRIVRLHGGRVWADSRPGEGATFRFTLAPVGRGG